MTRAANICPDAETLKSFVTQGLSGEAGDDLRAHVDACLACKQRAEHLTEDDSLGESVATPALEHPLLEGQKVRRYIILGCLGRGGMGIVYAAYDTALDRKIALKFLTRARGDQRLMDRLLVEASAMARLSHPNVVTVHDVGVYGGAPYLAMEFVEGKTLAEWQRAQPRSPREIATVMAATARGLAAAHAAGIVHRDIKPQNVLVAGTRVQVTDFGVSVDVAEPTRGEVVGTPGYMSPEQLQGGPVDHRADVFGFCATLYEMLHGARPFALVSTPSGPSIQADTPPPQAPPKGSRVPAWLHRLALSGLAADPANRPPDMAALADALSADPPRRRRRALLASAGALVVLAAFWGGLHGAASAERRCQQGAAVIDADFAQATRLPLRQRFERAGKAQAWTIAERHLARYAARWRDTYRDNCSATYGDRRQSSEVFDLRMACLAGRRVALQTLLAGLPAVPETKLSSIAGAAGALPDLADCDASARPGLRALPIDPEQRKRVAAVDATIDQAIAKVVLGDYAAAGNLAASAIAAARAVGYEPVLARALAQAANIEGRRGGVQQIDGKAVTAEDRAAQMLEEAYVLAENGHDDRMRLGVARELVITELERGRQQEAETWANRASAILTRLGNPPDKASHLAASIGWLRLARGQRPEAAEAFNRSVELSKKVLAPDDLDHIAPRVGACETREGRPDRNRCYRDLLPFARSVLGPDHPTVGIIQTHLADGLMNDPATRAEACDLFRSTLRLTERNVEPTHDTRLSAMQNLASCLDMQHKPDEARPLFEKALALAPSQISTRASIHSNFAEFLANNGRRDEALGHARAGLADRRSAMDDSNDQVLYSWSVVTEILAASGRSDEALRELDQAIAAGKRAASPSGELARLHDQRGLLLTESRKRFQHARIDHQASLAIHDRLQLSENKRHYPLYGLGLAELGLGLAGPALTHLQRAHELRVMGGSTSDLRGDSAFALARALLLAGQPRARACALALEAVTPYREAGADRRPQLQQLQTWLIRHTCRAAGS